MRRNEAKDCQCGVETLEREGVEGKAREREDEAGSGRTTNAAEKREQGTSLKGERTIVGAGEQRCTTRAASPSRPPGSGDRWGPAEKFSPWSP